MTSTLTVTQATKELGVSRSSIYRLIEQGKFDIIRMKAHGKHLIERPSFDRWVNSHRIKATAFGKS